MKKKFIILNFETISKRMFFLITTDNLLKSEVNGLLSSKNMLIKLNFVCKHKLMYIKELYRYYALNITYSSVRTLLTAQSKPKYCKSWFNMVVFESYILASTGYSEGSINSLPVDITATEGLCKGTVWPTEAISDFITTGDKSTLGKSAASFAKSQPLDLKNKLFSFTLHKDYIQISYLMSKSLFGSTKISTRSSKPFFLVFNNFVSSTCMTQSAISGTGAPVLIL